MYIIYSCQTQRTVFMPACSIVWPGLSVALMNVHFRTTSCSSRQLILLHILVCNVCKQRPTMQLNDRPANASRTYHKFRASKFVEILLWATYYLWIDESGGSKTAKRSVRICLDHRMRITFLLSEKDEKLQGRNLNSALKCDAEKNKKMKKKKKKMSVAPAQPTGPNKQVGVSSLSKLLIQLNLLKHGTSKQPRTKQAADISGWKLFRVWLSLEWKHATGKIAFWEWDSQRQCWNLPE